MSLIDLLEPIYGRLPEVKVPEVQPPLKKKLIWSALALVLFFVMGQITLIGMSSAAEEQFLQLQQILASNIGTIITAGIGPIVLASIILQLLVGGKIIDIDLTNPKDKARFSGLQKLFAIALSFFEAGVYVFSGFLTPMPGMFWVVVLQVAFGSIILLYLDEVVSKYGIGSGIGLFIAGGVSQTILWRFFAPPIPGAETSGLQAGGILAQFIGSLSGQANFILLLPMLFSIIVFLAVVYAEGMHINIPITMGRRGTGGRFPVKLLYVSNIPVILAVALFANIQLWAAMSPKIPVIGQVMAVVFGTLAEFTKSPFGLFETTLYSMWAEGPLAGILAMGPALFQAFIYLAILVAVCVVFGKFWVEMGGQGPEAVANQLQSSGMYIPGFRRDKRIIRKILDRYIPPITILGSAAVGLLAGFADFTGALGSGTGILLTVGIVYRLYEELAKEQLMETHPLMRKLMG